MKYCLYLCFTLSLFACKQKPAAHKIAAKNAVDNIINFSCAVIITPSDEKINELKKNNPESAYNTIVDDNENYEAESTTFLDSVRVKQIFRRSAGILTFKTATGQVFKVHLNKYSWGVILFNRKSKPIDADMTDMPDSYNSCMK